MSPNPERILQTGLAFWASKTLLSAIELDLFTELANGPRTEAELRAAVGLHARGARDFLDALVALGFLSRENGAYSNTPETAVFLNRNHPAYIGGMLEMANARLWPAWGRLTDALRTGERQNETRGTGEVFEKLYEDSERLKIFLKAMTGISRGANMIIARQLPWSRYKTYADIGTAEGDLAVQIALANPHLTGIGFDLAPVASVFEPYATQNNVADRVRFQAGDFFKDALPHADVITMGHMLHGWGLDTKKMLVRNAFEALPAGGMLAVYDSLIDDDRSKNAFGLMMSLNMLLETAEGFDYTGADCQSWMKEAGFGETRVEHLVGPDYVVIGVKPGG